MSQKHSSDWRRVVVSRSAAPDTEANDTKARERQNNFARNQVPIDYQNYANTKIVDFTSTQVKSVYNKNDYKNERARKSGHQPGRSIVCRRLWSQVGGDAYSLSLLLLVVMWFASGPVLQWIDMATVNNWLHRVCLADIADLFGG